ncbi:MAG: glycosyltransferase [Owenweeksia sp.]|nr:glycosyltransferase [Owenweeksia sp.]
MQLIQLTSPRRFTELPMPANMSALPKPIICYVGNIERRMDFSLLVEVAKHNPEMTFMMVGPVNEDNPELNAAKKIPNIRFTGPQPFDQIPAYLKYSDCSIIPFKINDLTQCIYPLKINEYLAAGKAVVSTPFSPDILSFSDVIEIAKDPADFSESIKKSLSKNDTTEVRKRVERASGNDWQSRATEFLETIDAHL